MLSVLKSIIRINNKKLNKLICNHQLILPVTLFTSSGNFEETKSIGFIKEESKVKTLSINKLIEMDAETFKGSIDRFNGVTISSKDEPCDIAKFPAKLEESLKLWIKQGNRGIWFRVHLNQSDWIPILVKKGFRYHNAVEEVATLTLWLPKNENCSIPHYAHTMLGVGAVVVNDKHEILAVREKHYDRPHWKLPGGHVDPKENIVDAAIREVEEETNIKCQFKSILTLRHTHHGMFGCSDIYVVVALTPLTTDITKCEREIDLCEWIKIDNFLQMPEVHELNRFFVQKYLEHEKKGIKIGCHHGIHQILKKPYIVYSVTNDHNDKRAQFIRKESQV